MLLIRPNTRKSASCVDLASFIYVVFLETFSCTFPVVAFARQSAYSRRGISRSPVSSGLCRRTRLLAPRLTTELIWGNQILCSSTLFCPGAYCCFSYCYYYSRHYRGWSLRLLGTVQSYGGSTNQYVHVANFVPCCLPVSTEGLFSCTLSPSMVSTLGLLSYVCRTGSRPLHEAAGEKRPVLTMERQSDFKGDQSHIVKAQQQQKQQQQGYWTGPDLTPRWKAE